MNWIDSDAPLRAILGAQGNDRWLRSVEEAARERVAELAAAADKYGPRLITHDRNGVRIDEIEYHPSYREMQQIAYGELGLVARRYHEGVSQTLGFAAGYLFNQAEAGLMCPVCMTDGAARVLKKFGDLPELVERLTTRDMSKLATGAMFLTEKAGGSDVGQTETVARREGDGDDWRLYGDKWFCSNVDAGVILALARPDGAPAGTKGLGLFVVTERRGMTINRIKDKLGVRSMPTGEVTFAGTPARVVGDVTRGFYYMAEMMNMSRLYNAVGSIAGMRRAIREGRAWVEERVVFGKRAIEQPLCMEMLADLEAETAAATHLVFDGIAHLDGPDERDRKLIRILTPLMKYYTGKLTVWACSEGMELLGGNGYIEDFPTPRMLRDAQVLPIWEGTTNICVLDALRAIAREGAAEPLFGVIRERLSSAKHPLREPTERHLSLVIDALERMDQGAARRVCDRLVAVYQIAASLGRGTERDVLIAERLFERHLEPQLMPRGIDSGRLRVLLG